VVGSVNLNVVIVIAVDDDTTISADFGFEHADVPKSIDKIAITPK
jgi:hypothetical protein